MSAIQIIITIILALLLFTLIIFIHELGHFIFAKKYGVKVNEFALGMGPKIFSKQKGDTLYSLRLLPIGGYCAMEGEDNDSEDERAFIRAKVWQRIIIITAGAIFNIILGLIFMLIVQGQEDVYATKKISSFVPTAISEAEYLNVSDSDMIFYYTTGEQDDTYKELVRNQNQKGVTDRETVTYDEVKGTGYILRNATSSRTGLKYNDIIYSVNGSRALCFYDAYFEMSLDEDGIMDFVVLRDGEKVTVKNVQFDKDKKGMTVLDFHVYPEEKTFGSLIKNTFLQSQYMIRSVYKSFFRLITGRVPVSEMSGPVGIAKAIGDVAQAGFSVGFVNGIMNILLLMTVITFNLGIFNLLPLPALDGGRLIFLIIEAVRGKPLNQKYEGVIHTIGFILLMLLMLLVSYQDIAKLITSCTG